jgi:hypothetical protein
MVERIMKNATPLTIPTTHAWACQLFCAFKIFPQLKME